MNVLSLIERSITGSDEAAASLLQTPLGQLVYCAMAQYRGIKIRCEDSKRNPIGEELLLPNTKGVGFAVTQPGQYRIVMQTGRVLWEGALDASHIFSSFARDAELFRAAAQSGEFTTRSTLQDSAANGVITITVFPGRQSGVLVCTLAA